MDYLENAYITTFDSYTLSLVKKYHYLLNISSNVSIISDSVINIIKKDYMDEIFNELYNEENPLFQKLLKDLTVKNDTEIKASILDIIKKIDLISNKNEFLNNYIDNYLNDEQINKYIEEYNNLIKKNILIIENNLINISSTSYYEYYEILLKSLEKLIKSKDYDEVKQNINVNIPNRPKGSEEIKEYKKNIDDNIKKIKDYLRFDSINEIKEIFNLTKDYLKIIIEIIKILL